MFKYIWSTWCIINGKSNNGLISYIGSHDTICVISRLTSCGFNSGSFPCNIWTYTRIIILSRKIFTVFSMCFHSTDLFSIKIFISINNINTINIIARYTRILYINSHIRFAINTMRSSIESMYKMLCKEPNVL